jgi:type IV secretion system protein TrbC
VSNKIKVFKKVAKVAKVAMSSITMYMCMLHIALASTSDAAGMPWEGPLQKVMTSISGPVAKILGVIVIVLAGLGLAFGEVGSGVKRLLQIVIGLAIAFSAASVISTLYTGGASGLTF